MKPISIILLAILTISRCSNPTPIDKEGVLVWLNNTKTDKHQRFPGTKTFIIPPTGFELLRQFSRFSTKDQSSYIQTYETTSTPYNPDNFTKEAIDSLGEKLIDWDKIKIQGYDGVLVFAEVREDSTKRKGILVFGDKGFSSMVIARFPKTDNQMKEEIKNSLKTVYYDNSFELNPLELANFDIDLSKTDFKVNNTMTNIFTFTHNGQGSSFNSIDQTKIVIQQLQSLGDSTAIKNYAQRIIQEYKNGGIIIKDISSKGKIINGHYAYESKIKAETQGKQNIIYQLVLSDSKSTILFSGNAFEDFDNNLNIFETVAQTLKAK